ncbi:SMC-Scp complex subunit ScpB [Modestobacter sp. SSW1-42]|uniref:SMC-Scp complex subunit ScpB n=1 Tax=Modestobacter sp. SSW1-42 TaxID=596372 RepID=UPI0039876758
MSDEPTAPRPFSWDAVVAEVAAGLAEAEDGGTDGAQDWDAVAARLAAEFGRPAADADATAPASRVLGRAPADPPVELVVVPEPEAPVEELVDAVDGQQELLLDTPVDDAALRGGLEALLFVTDSPLDEVSLAAALQTPVSRVRAGLAALATDYDQRRAGITLRRVGEGWRLYTREEHAPVVERHLLEGQRSRLTQAALETLAVIAYRQPVTRARVSAIRGVGVDAVVRTLTARGLIREAGSDPDTGGGLYVTTPLFLERLGLTDLGELPELAPLLPDTRSVLDEHPDS